MAAPRPQTVNSLARRTRSADSEVHVEVLLTDRQRSSGGGLGWGGSVSTNQPSAGASDMQLEEESGAAAQEETGLQILIQGTSASGSSNAVGMYNCDTVGHIPMVVGAAGAALGVWMMVQTQPTLPQMTWK